MSLSQLYQTQILEHNRRPHNHFELENPTHSARGLDALCGDDMRVWLRVDSRVVRAASWSGEACAITTASASMLTEWLPGKELDRIRPTFQRFARILEDPEQADDPELGEMNALRAVGRFPSRKRNALLPWKTVLDALGDHS